MKKILRLVDDNILRFGVAFAILFTALYPKLPSIHINNTWVYVRLEDFLILFLAGLWFIQLLRKKVSLPRPEGYALILYWIAGAVSLAYCIAFVIPTLNMEFFPMVAWLQYFRRIEYMILFFIAFSAIKNKNDVRFFVGTLTIAVVGVVLYGFGQKFYLLIWNFFPDYFRVNQFCFPAFLTGNEEFAKGTPFCLDELSRSSSTFGGHYDLAAYLVLVIPIFVALFIKINRWYVRLPLVLLVVCALELLNFTSSRTSYAAYVLGTLGMLVLWKKKLWIIPVMLISLGVLFFLSNATLQRFSKTIQPVQLVQLQPGTVANDTEIQQIISTTQQKNANKRPQTPAPGTVTLGTGQTGGQVLTAEDLKALEENSKISTVSGNFLLKKAYALDISFTTRFQAEWPRNWNAFLYSPLFGTGYSTLTLATDNDYLRALGETGLAGFLTFFFIFIVLGIFMKSVIGSVKDNLTQAFMWGVTGGVIGLLINATLIDVFEASKVAEPMWLLLGVAVGAGKLYYKPKIEYKEKLLSLFTSKFMILLYLFALTFIGFGGAINNFFVADDFSWLRWAATAVPSDLARYFVWSPDFFYRPLDKVIVYFLYQLFSFQPQGYHIFILLLHFIMSVCVFYFVKKLTRDKVVAVVSALLFVLHPAHSENLFWFSTISVELGAVFVLAMLMAYSRFRDKGSVFGYALSILFATLAFVSYEIAVIAPLVVMLYDFFIHKPKRSLKLLYTYIPFWLLLVGYFIMRSVSHAFSGGGDYSYSLSNLVPNVVGNFFGYTGLFIGGHDFLPWYTMLRDSARSQVGIVLIVLLAIVALIVWAVMRYRSNLKHLLANKTAQLVLFSLVFAFVALIPFLALGNIAPRYLYLASVGYMLAFVLLLRAVLTPWLNKPKYVVWAMLLITILLSYFSFVGIGKEQLKWKQAGTITQETLLFFRKNQQGLNTNNQLYFVNTPVQKDGVWVFPVGLNDGLWFIYRDKLPQVTQVNSLSEAQKLSGNVPSAHIFMYDPNGVITEVK